MRNIWVTPRIKYFFATDISAAYYAARPSDPRIIYYAVTTCDYFFSATAYYAARSPIPELFIMQLLSVIIFFAPLHIMQPERLF